MFGTPRIAIWPIDSEYGSDPTPTNATKLVTTFDKLVAFCTTTHGPNSAIYQYYFQRHDSTSPTSDWTDIKRNQKLYAYLQNLTDRQIPGFGGKFSAKYSVTDERDQILTEIVDYIRCTNLYDHSMKDPTPSNPNPRFTPKADAGSGSGQVVPLRIGSTQGLADVYDLRAGRPPDLHRRWEWRREQPERPAAQEQYTG